MDRRSLMKTALLVLAGGPPVLKNALQISVAQAREPATWRHGLSKLSNLKYSAGFKHFEYVNPNAPKGGTASQIALGSFDNFNVVVGGAKGTLVSGVEYLYDTLMVSALDEVASSYGLLAEAVGYPDDFSSATFRLRSNAKWNDGKPVTPEDVVFSFDAFKKFSPQAAAIYRQVTKAEKTGEHEVTFYFDGTGNHELPQVVGQLTILPKHWWDGTDSEGKKRLIGETTLEPPLGSGPYRIKEFSAGRNITYERVQDYWGKNLNVNTGRDNFDNLRYEYFRDATIAIEAFKGDLVDWRTENSAKNWATAYDFSAVTEKRVVLEEFPINNIGLMQAFAFNLRRDKFKDPRIRLAFNYAFDFASLQKATLYIVFVVSPKAEEDKEKIVKFGMEVLDKLKQRAAQRGLEVTTMLEAGSPYETILSVSDRIKADTIIVGTSGSALERATYPGELLDCDQCHVTPALPGSANWGLPGAAAQRAIDVDRAAGRAAAFEVGAGAVGIESAIGLKRAGKEVTVVEMLPRLVPLEDEEVSASGGCGGSGVSTG